MRLILLSSRTIAQPHYLRECVMLTSSTTNEVKTNDEGVPGDKRRTTSDARHAPLNVIARDEDEAFRIALLWREARRSIATTQRYAHVLDEDTRKALDDIESRNSPEVGSVNV